LISESSLNSGDKILFCSLYDFEYVKKAVGNGTRSGARALFVDARPNKKYIQATIPSSINIPDTRIDQYVGQLDSVAKDREIIVICGGWKCEKTQLSLDI